MKIAIVLSGFPRRSETFALNEVLALDRRGLLGTIFATKAGDGLPLQPGCEGLLARVQYLPSGDATQQACAVVDQLHGSRLDSIHAIHAYFAHTPAAVAEQAAARLGIPFGFSTHAKDARKVPSDELARRARAAACIVACNPDVAHDLTSVGASVKLLPHGVDLQRFQPSRLPEDRYLHLLAVGRLVEKKGFDRLIQAVAHLPAPFHLRIVGDGPQEAHLRQLIATYGLAEQVELLPSITHAALPAFFAESHVVVVPSVVDSAGDRDGVPNVLLEAMASGRAVVASDAGAIPSAVIHNQTGLLLPQGDVSALTAALTQLAQDREQCQQFGINARIHVEKNFALRACSDRFCNFLQDVYL